MKPTFPSKAEFEVWLHLQSMKDELSVHDWSSCWHWHWGRMHVVAQKLELGQMSKSQTSNLLLFTSLFSVLLTVCLCACAYMCTFKLLLKWLKQPVRLLCITIGIHFEVRHAKCPLLLLWNIIKNWNLCFGTGGDVNFSIMFNGFVARV